MLTTNELLKVLLNKLGIRLLGAYYIAMKLAKIHKRIEPSWHVQLAIVAAIITQVFLSHDYVVGPRFAMAIFEFVVLVALSIPYANPPSRTRGTIRRLLAIILLVIISVSNIVSLILVSNALLNGTANNGHQLIFSALVIYAVNVIVFGLLYWELDDRNTEGLADTVRDFLFPQMMTTPAVTKQPNWQPTFFDYLYVSITNATAFSPTDTMPLTRRAKLLMSVQAFTSLAVVALVAARAVNILR